MSTSPRPKSRRAKVAAPVPFTDRERILMTIVTELAFTQCLCPFAAGKWSSEPYEDRSLGRTHVHFAPWRKPVAGDLVIGKTGGVDRWKVAFYVHPLGGGLGGAMLREIGTSRLCEMSNESFEVIVGLTPDQLLEGDRYQVSLRVRAAFARLKDSAHGYTHRFGGVDFPALNPDGTDPMTATVWVREVWGGTLRLGGRKTSLPYQIPLSWTPKMSVKAIVAAMLEGGYGTRQFELDPNSGDPIVEGVAATTSVVVVSNPPLSS